MENLVFDPFLHDQTCVAYLRVSTKKQRSWHWQEKVIEDFCDKRNLVIDKWFREHISGKTLAHQRPVFIEACKYCEENGFTMLVPSVDRLARNITFAYEFGECDFRGDFSVEIICPSLRYGHFSVEALGLSSVLCVELTEMMLGDSDDEDVRSQIEYLKNIKNSFKNI